MVASIGLRIVQRVVLSKEMALRMSSKKTESDLLVATMKESYMGTRVGFVRMF